MPIYRDPLSGLRSQVATKRGQLEELRSRVTPVLRSLAARTLRERLATPPSVPEPLPETVEALTSLDASLDLAIVAHEELLAASTRLRRCPHDVEEFARPRQSPPWLIEEGPTLAFRRRFAERVESLAPGTSLVRWGDHAYVARFSVRGAPVHVLLRGGEPTLDGAVPAHTAAVRTSVPEGMPMVEVRPERMHHALGKVLGLAREVATGHAPFDDAYWVAGDEDAAAALSPGVHAALLELADRRPELALGRGVVELRWRGASSERGERLLPDAALDVVLGVREAIEGT